MVVSTSSINIGLVATHFDQEHAADVVARTNGVVELGHV